MKKIINIIILILWMLFIFTMSNFNAVDSSSQSGIVVNMISNVVSINNIEVITIIVRKLAHIIEYFILGILMYNVLKDYNIKNIFIISIILCVIYAISDETHQIFINGRSGEVLDVFIDSIGIILGNIIYKKVHKNN